MASGQEEKALKVLQDIATVAIGEQAADPETRIKACALILEHYRLQRLYPESKGHVMKEETDPQDVEQEVPQPAPALEKPVADEPAETSGDAESGS